LRLFGRFRVLADDGHFKTAWVVSLQRLKLTSRDSVEIGQRPTPQRPNARLEVSMEEV